VKSCLDEIHDWMERVGFPPDLPLGEAAFCTWPVESPCRIACPRCGGSIVPEPPEPRRATTDRPGSHFCRGRGPLLELSRCRGCSMELWAPYWHKGERR